ncbi:cell cycle checkpoint protein RAD17 [Rhinatrema bivittatum]|uniref:cell cycle checkpoint protein RAD17 n=1 Tax=Rhinatrema bivittatum TaxID=194408 RepID=UPI00112933D5|nr:cell cycle checkpoint protein RAD17 [Rhinatrema bivittatum]XP_029430152.1 cell cycle checkpoint protein RAD17 [Rhinatrema bivittatum]
MSTTSYSRKIASAKLTDWVEPSFEDFCGSPAFLSSASWTKPLGRRQQRTKGQSSSTGSSSSNSKCQNQKRAKPFSTEQQSSQPENDAWIVKYKPETQTELAVHKKKIEEVEAWLKLHVVQREPKQGGSLLLLTGPPGCGKTATVQVLAKDLGLQVQEWTNPVFLDAKNLFDHDSRYQTFPSQSQTVLFQEFLLRANKYNKLQMVGESLETDKKLVLVEDMPNLFYREPASLQQILRRFVQTGRCPLVFIVSDSFSGDSNQRLLFPKEIQEELSLSNISFNPIAPTSMMKVLHRIAAAEANVSGGRIVPDKTTLELLCSGSSGDIRSAINSLQFSSLKDSSLRDTSWSIKKGKTAPKLGKTSSRAKQKQNLEKVLDKQELPQAIGGKDASLFLFRALGKILYCKREPVTDSHFPRLPPHLSAHERDLLLTQPEAVVEKSHMPGDLFNLYLHQNYLDFLTDIDDVVRSSEYLSAADFLTGDWTSRAALREYSASVATRGVIHSNTARAFAHRQTGVGFKPLHKPQWLLINKKYRENCLAAKALFSSFCLTPLCIQTQLLPYLALLTNPMRNQAQIAFIQDVGRLPLKRHFERLKLESLTDKEPGVLHQDSCDEEEPAGAQPEQALEQAEKSDACDEPVADESCLPASQPQPSTAQAIMEEEEIKIDEYYSD